VCRVAVIVAIPPFLELAHALDLAMAAFNSILLVARKQTG
jgi:hypothetical protein